MANEDLTPDNISDSLPSLNDSNDATPNWKSRNRTCYITLVFCAMCLLYILHTGKDLQIYQTIAFGCFGLAGTTIGFLVGSQTWHNINCDKMDTLTKLRNPNPNGGQ